MSADKEPFWKRQSQNIWQQSSARVDRFAHRARPLRLGGDPMHGSRGIRRCRVLASIGMLFGAIFTILLLPAYGKQEVDPTWYDPWAAPNTVVVHPSQPPAAAHSSQPPVATHRHQQMVKPVSSTPGAGKFRGKAPELDQSRHSAAHKSGGTPVLVFP